MINQEIAQSYAEILELLKYYPKEQLQKIPKKFIQTMEMYADKKYVVKLDPNKRLAKQNLKNKTKDLIALIYRNYLSNEEEKRKIDKILIENDKKYEEKLYQKYNVENIFKKEK